MKMKMYINLLAFKGSKVENGNVIIPIKDNNLWTKSVEGHEEILTTVSASLVAWELRERSRYGDTHLLKQSLTKEQREQMTKEQLEKMPIMGRMRPIEPKTEDNDDDKAF